VRISFSTCGSHGNDRHTKRCCGTGAAPEVSFPSLINNLSVTHPLFLESPYQDCFFPTVQPVPPQQSELFCLSQAKLLHPSVFLFAPFKTSFFQRSRRICLTFACTGQGKGAFPFSRAYSNSFSAGIVVSYTAPPLAPSAPLFQNGTFQSLIQTERGKGSSIPFQLRSPPELHPIHIPLYARRRRDRFWDYI